MFHLIKVKVFWSKGRRSGGPTIFSPDQAQLAKVQPDRSRTQPDFFKYFFWPDLNANPCFGRTIFGPWELRKNLRKNFQ